MIDSGRNWIAAVSLNLYRREREKTMDIWNLFRKKTPPPPPPLASDYCQCGDARCFHVRGVGKCRVKEPPRTECNPTDEWAQCSCVYFVKDDNRGGDDPDDGNGGGDPSVSIKELERMMR